MKIYIQYNTLEVNLDVEPSELTEVIGTLVTLASNVSPRQVVMGKALQNALMQKSHGTPEATTNDDDTPKA